MEKTTNKKAGIGDITKRGTPRKGGFKGGKREAAQLTWSIEDYGVQRLNRRTEAELRKEYSRLRSIIRKRLERMGASDFKRTEFYKSKSGYYVPLKQIKDKRSLVRLLHDLSVDIRSRRSQTSKMEKQRDSFLDTMHEKGYTFLNKSNYFDFIDFMSAAEREGLKLLYDSERIVEFFEDVKEQKQIPEAQLRSKFEEWYKQQHPKEFKRYESRTKWDSDRITEFINKGE